jgi:ATP-binding cassette, subfamily B, bacterial
MKADIAKRSLFHQAAQIVGSWKQAVGLLARACPALSVAVAVLTIVEAMVSVGILYAFKLLVDALSSDVDSLRAEGIGDLAPYLGLVGAAIVASVLLQNLANLLRMRQGLLVGEFVDREIHDRAIAVDLSFYESPLYYDALERARHGGSQRPAQIISSIVNAFKAAIILVFVVMLIARINLYMLPFLLAPIAIALAVRLHYTRRAFQWRMQRTQPERRAGYLDWMLTSAAHAKELRLNHIGPYFVDQYRTLRREIRDGQMRIEQARMWSELAVAMIAAAVFLVSTAWLLNQSISQHQPLGDVVLFVLLLRRAEGAGGELIGSASRIVDDHLYLQRLFDFLAIKPAINVGGARRALPAQIEHGVRLEDISFRYDGAADFALQNISLQIKPGQIVALVGENGSGKTTLIKLLTRLYDPVSGRCTLDGADIREFDVDQYRRLFSVIFQDYAMYADTAGDNIRYGDVTARHAEAAIAEAARRAGAADFLERLPQSYQTPLTKLFDNGQDLSIGQWQRLALARAFYPPSKFMILDEPTSAVDPKAEFELFEHFRGRLGGRGALIISHRLSTVRQADYTYVLQQGRIIEHGVHDDLIKAQSAYADLFEKQGRQYR